MASNCSSFVRDAVAHRVRQHAIALASGRPEWAGTLDPDVAVRAVIDAVSHGCAARLSAQGPHQGEVDAGSASAAAALPGQFTTCAPNSRAEPPRTLRVRSLVEALGLAPLHVRPCDEWWSEDDKSNVAAVLLVRVEAGGTAAFPVDTLRACDNTAVLSCNFARADPCGLLAPVPDEWVVCVEYGVAVGELPGGAGRAAWLEVTRWVNVPLSHLPPPLRPVVSSRTLTPVHVSHIAAALADPARRGAVDVVGEVTAVSPVLPLKGVSIFFVEVAQRLEGGAIATQQPARHVPCCTSRLCAHFCYALVLIEFLFFFPLWCGVVRALDVTQ
jgi:hypothetical protein